jgi:hypothetical protein
MINFNGTIVAQDTNILTQNRAFCTEMQSLKPLKLTVKFCFRDHYFRLMASMRCVWKSYELYHGIHGRVMISVANANGFIDFRVRLPEMTEATYQTNEVFFNLCKPLLVSYMVLKTQSMKLIYSKIFILLNNYCLL